MFSQNPICKLFKIRYPIIQAGMVWCSGWKLAVAVSNAGGLGLIGAGSMSPEILREHIRKARLRTTNPFGVNIPMMGRDVEEKIAILIEEKVEIVFSSAGNPAKWTSNFKEKGIKVVHVIASAQFAAKAEAAGVDAIVAEGFEAGGHNGREETTSFVLLPSVRQATTLPLIAAGGMYSGQSLLAAQALGADAIQVGSRFVVANESSAHEAFKKKVLEINEGETRLSLKKLVPVRLIKNEFYKRITEAEEAGANARALYEILGEGRSRKGMFEGDLLEGELEIGQVSALLNKQQSAAEIVNEIISEYTLLLKKFNNSLV